jgi:hypothetical protein
MKGKRLLRNDPLVFQACVLGYPCKVLKFDSGIVRFSWRLRLLNPFAT